MYISDSNVPYGPLSIASHGWRSAVIAVMFAGLALAMGAAPAQALPVCTTSISACCRITSANVYGLTGPVTAVAGGDCIQIIKPGVTLNLNNFNMIGFNSAGVGIHVLSTATGAVINGGADLTSLTPSNISEFLDRPSQ